MRPRTLNRLLVAAALGIAGVVVLAQQLGVRINTTPSIGRGLWRVSEAPVAAGAYVLVCPPTTAPFTLARSRGYLAAGLCPGEFAPLMKRVVGVAGDRVEINALGMRVNGRLLAHSAPREHDGAGRPLAAWSPSGFELAADELLLYGDATPSSWDARYFGPVPRHLVRHVIEPLLLMDDPHHD